MIFTTPISKQRQCLKKRNIFELRFYHKTYKVCENSFKLNKSVMQIFSIIASPKPIEPQNKIYMYFTLFCGYHCFASILSSYPLQATADIDSILLTSRTTRPYVSLENQFPLAIAKRSHIIHLTQPKFTKDRLNIEYPKDNQIVANSQEVIAVFKGI